MEAFSSVRRQRLRNKLAGGVREAGRVAMGVADDGNNQDRKLCEVIRRNGQQLLIDIIFYPRLESSNHFPCSRTFNTRRYLCANSSNVQTDFHVGVQYVLLLITDVSFPLWLELGTFIFFC